MVGTQQLPSSQRLSVIWIERRIPRLRRAVPSELEFKLEEPFARPLKVSCIIQLEAGQLPWQK